MAPIKIKILFFINLVFLLYSALVGIQVYGSKFPSYFVMKNHQVGGLLASTAKAELKYRDLVLNEKSEEEKMYVEILRRKEVLHFTLPFQSLSYDNFFFFILVPSICAFIYFIVSLFFFYTPFNFPKKNEITTFLGLVSIYLSLLFEFHSGRPLSLFFLASFMLSSFMLLHLAFSLSLNLNKRKFAEKILFSLGFGIGLFYLCSFHFHWSTWVYSEVLAAIFASFTYFFWLYQLQLAQKKNRNPFLKTFARFLFWGNFLSFISPVLALSFTYLSEKSFSFHWIIPFSTLLPFSIFLSALLAALKDSQQKLVESEKMALMGKLFSGITHEINNPLNFISANLSTLKEYLDFLKTEHSENILYKNKLSKNELWKESEEILGEMKLGTSRLEQIVSNFKKMGRAEQCETETFEILPVIQEALSYLSSQYPLLNQRCKINIPNHLTISFPKTLFLEIFMNLFSNAAQASKLQDSSKTIQLSVIEAPKELKLLLRDQGQGMSPEVLEQCRESFFTTKAAGEGTGLGLSLVDRWLKQNGGKLEIESILGKGSSLWITLPR